MDRVQTAQGEHAEQVSQLAGEGSSSILGYVLGLPLEERLAATRATQKILFAAAKNAAGLDLYAETLRALIDRGTFGLRAGDSEDDDKTLDGYNALSFNLAADLADCWPGDELPRERRHFEAGLKAAEDCIRWRNELNKPPRPFSLAYWAKGMHLLSLGHPGAAAHSFNLALGFARRASECKGQAADTGNEASFDVLLNTGYLGLAEHLEGIEGGLQRFESALADFRQQTEGSDAETKEEAEFGIAQLETVRQKYVV